MTKEITQKLGFKAGGALRTLGDLQKRLKSTTDVLKQFKGEADKLGVGTNLGPVGKQVDKAKKKTQEFTVSWQTMARVIQTQIIVRSLNRVIQSLAEGIERAQELGLKIAEIQTIGQGLNQTSAELASRILQTSGQIAGVSAAQFAEGLYQTISNQVVGIGEAFEFTSKSAVLAKVTMVDTKDAINALSSVMNSYGMGAERAAYISDTLFKSVEQGRLRLGDLANILGRVTPITAELGIKWEEVAASIVVMTRQGTRADTALTQLRAIVSALLKPSEGLTKIFERWGVKDGKTAIATFGGLQGVLKKLSQETGGSSAEMADLLKNVRAISGFFGTMTEEGRALEEAIKGITDASGALDSAWERFKLEPAQQLAQSIERYQNVTAELATKSLPQLVFWHKAKYHTINGILQTVKFINGEYGLQGRLVTKVEEGQKKLNRRLELNRQMMEELNKKDWQEALQNVNRYYAELNKQEINYRKVRDNTLAGSRAVFEAAGKGIIEIFADANKKLEDFIKKAKETGKAAASEIAEIDKKLRDDTRQTKIDRAGGGYHGLSILDKDILAQQRKVAEAFGKIDFTQESKERALNEARVLEELTSQGREMARQLGHTATINKWSDKYRSSLHLQKQIIEKSAQEQMAGLPAAEKRLEVAKLEEERLKAAMKEYTELRIELSSTKDPQARAILEERINSLKEEMKGIFKDVDMAMAFYDSLGIGENMKLLSTELEIALNSSEKNWQAEFDRAQKVFSRHELKVNLSIDPQGFIRTTADILNIDKRADESVIEWSQRVQEEALKVEKQWNESAGAIRDQTDTLSQSMRTTAEMIVDLKNETAEATKMGLEPRARRGFYGEGYDPKSLNEFKDAVKETYQQIREQKGVGQEVLNNLENQRQKVLETNGGLRTQLDAYRLVIAQLEDMNNSQLELNNIQKEAPSQGQYEAAKSLLQILEEHAGKYGETNDLSRHANDEIIKMEGLLRDVLGPQDQLKTGFNEAANNATNTQNTTVSIGEAIQTVIPSVASLIEVFKQVTAEAERAAIASKQIGPGNATNKYHGGPMKYFAFGGRGQDKIPAMLSRKETVVNARSSQRFFSELNAMNQGSKPVYREQGGTVTNVGDINVTVKGGDSSQQTVREIGQALRREVRRGTIKLR